MLEIKKYAINCYRYLLVYYVAEIKNRWEQLEGGQIENPTERD
jgi:hypothetical protein